MPRSPLDCASATLPLSAQRAAVQDAAPALQAAAVPSPTPMAAAGGFYRLQAFNQTSCCICLERYTADNPPVEYFCKHAFHLQCSEAWLMRSPRCPVCDRIIRGQPYRLIAGLPESLGSENSLSRSTTDFENVGTPLQLPTRRQQQSRPSRDANADDDAEDHDREHDALLSLPSSDCGRAANTTSSSNPDPPAARAFDECVPMEVDGVPAPSTTTRLAPALNSSPEESPVVAREGRVAKIARTIGLLASCACCWKRRRFASS